ncbi:hypothetical protein [Paraburkholderia saeva]|uniref:Multidrug ABC transporter ATPase n=1 Tax=Paraburkholderia saeva TaxID=2777537 RepID=A0A9N8RYQ2_9BURK|nr:hypothetical protein [Paraburkholderia saeva]CAG4902508.1 hypothetical protein R70241_02973 [Paraburkholderia saeva]CAG4908044.1 hypothetical protein LMG31841_03719 [Paraburkholderia saeva]CAG4911057.1 hypothetical protein R52603_03890 [Paraburkholderia saeva]
MLYLKNTLGGLSRSLTGSALQTFTGPNRWWKLALYLVMFVLPGGSIAVMIFAWVDHRRAVRDRATVAPTGLLTSASDQPGKAGKPAGATPSSAHLCQARCDAPPCRAAAGKQARQTSDSRG